MRNGSRQTDVLIEADGVMLPGLLGVPEAAIGLVLFAHGSGSSRLSSRNNAVAARLRKAGLATLLFDLLTETEADDRRKVFDIALLADRLTGAARWAVDAPATRGLPLGYFGASTGAAAALVAAASDGPTVSAIVSRGGRPDLAGDALPSVTAPTLLIVGGADGPVIGMNEQAQTRMCCACHLEIVPGAGHLFEEPGCLDRVSELAEGWFVEHLSRSV